VSSSNVYTDRCPIRGHCSEEQSNDYLVTSLFALIAVCSDRRLHADQNHLDKIYLGSEGALDSYCTRDRSLCLKLGTAFHFALSTVRHTKPSTLHGPYHLRFPAHLYSVSIAQIVRLVIYRLQVHIHCTYPSARHPLRSSSLRFPLAGRLATGAPSATHLTSPRYDQPLLYCAR
jgi:hypothetical protein